MRSLLKFEADNGIPKSPFLGVLVVDRTLAQLRMSDQMLRTLNP